LCWNLVLWLKSDYGGRYDYIVIYMSVMIVVMFECLLSMFSGLFVVYYVWMVSMLYLECRWLVTVVILCSMQLCFGFIILFESCLFGGCYWLCSSNIGIVVVDDNLVKCSISLGLLCLVTLLVQFVTRCN
jgi:hypothetical protein